MPNDFSWHILKLSWLAQGQIAKQIFALGISDCCGLKEHNFILKFLPHTVLWWNETQSSEHSRLLTIFKRNWDQFLVVLICFVSIRTNSFQPRTVNLDSKLPVFRPIYFPEQALDMNNLLMIVQSFKHKYQNPYKREVMAKIWKNKLQQLQIFIDQQQISNIKFPWYVPHLT